MDYDVKDLALADAGKARIEWADRDMPVLASIRERFEAEKPLDGLRIAACLHVTTETANLMRTLKAGGADIVLCATNPLSTQDDVAAALVEHYGIRTYAIKGEDTETYYEHIDAAIAHKPQMTMDDGADVVGRIHAEQPEMLEHIIGGTEETTTGVIRLAAMAADGALKYPIMAVNDAKTKHLFDNRYGTGQSTLDGIIRATNRLLAGRTLVVSGYGWCGRGIAMRAERHGRERHRLEIDPLKALEAVMDGFRVMPAVEAAKECDIWVTVTGDINVIDERSFKAMKDGAIICNSGHFNVEINIPQAPRAGRVRARGAPAGRGVHDGRRPHDLPARRRPAREPLLRRGPSGQRHGHELRQPGARARSTWSPTARTLAPGVYDVPAEIDEGIAKLKLETLGVKIDTLTAEQAKYLASWQEGTV